MSKSKKTTPERLLQTPQQVEDQFKAYIRDIAARPEQHQAETIERQIPPDSKHPSAIEALRCTALVRAAKTDMEAARHLNAATAHWKDFMLWDDSIKGEKFSGGKPKGAIGPVARKIKAYLQKNPSHKADAVWQALGKKPPTGMTFMETRSLGRYIEKGAEQIMEWKRFQNLVSEHRPKK